MGEELSSVGALPIKGNRMELPMDANAKRDAANGKDKLACLTLCSPDQDKNRDSSTSGSVSCVPDWRRSPQQRLVLAELEHPHMPAAYPEHTGYIHSLVPEQREKMYHIYGMLIAHALGDAGCPKKTADGQTCTASKRREDALNLLRRARSEAFKRTTFALTPEEQIVLNGSALWQEFAVQMATDDPEATILRFLRARKWAVPDAFIMLVDSLTWRIEFRVQELLALGEVRVGRSPLEKGKNFFWKSDNAGNLVCFVRSRMHDRNAQTLAESMDHTIYSVEVGRRLRSSEDQLVAVVFDLADAGLSSMDLGILQFMIGCFQSYYPEILGLCLIKDAPWIFGSFWTVLKPMLDPVVAAKIHFVSQASLKDYIPAENLPVSYGGADPFEYCYVPPSEEEAERAKAVAQHMRSGRPAEERVARVERPSRLRWLFSRRTTTVASKGRSLTSVSESLVVAQSAESSPDAARPSSVIPAAGAAVPNDICALASIERDICAETAQFVALTREMHSIVTRVWEGEDAETHVTALRPARDASKARLRALYRERDVRVFGETHYHRVGVLGRSDGSVDWGRYVPGGRTADAQKDSGAA